MNKKETAQILAIVRTAYPNTKIENAAATVEAWYMGLGDYSASSVMKAARLHMATKRFFPTIAEIREQIIRAELIYSDTELEPNNQKLLGTKNDLIVIDDIDEKLEDFCKSIGLGYDNDIEGE